MDVEYSSSGVLSVYELVCAHVCLCVFYMHICGKERQIIFPHCFLSYLL